MQDGTPGRGGVREDRGHDGGVVAVGGNVDEDGAPLGGGFDGILLDGDQVADALLGPGVTVAGVARQGIACQVAQRVLVPGERADDRGVSQGLDVGVEAGGQGARGVTEEADDQLVAQFEARQDATGLAQGAHGLGGGESVVSGGLGENVAPVDVDAGAAQGVFELGRQQRAVSDGDEHVVVAPHEAHGAQEGGGGDDLGPVSPRRGSNGQVDGPGAVRGGALLGAGDDRAGPAERAS